ncbi:hypothetical protein ATE49_02725 [Elizabethkingia miricola]|uniref:Jacalin-type lectin domain-containing protein n=1 Tax=Elizabethkingia miricola TaxID=172045 RepID=A0ABY3NID1_ELIMR|nr:DUF5977 domain-containing protein [Elizabethkingia miricola]OBS14278.1 hypothetical protein ATE49_02725 [Elizabethkingia miricola]TYO92898.1 hypothetical protein LX74_00959 [Elizabethkingia miricola]
MNTKIVLKKTFLLILLVFQYKNLLKSQILNGNNYQTFNVATPEVSSLMNLSTLPQVDAIGATDISIPIYNIKLDEMDIPITLKYNTKGSPIDQTAPNTGLGWNLIGGGNIFFKINDLHDFYASIVPSTGEYIVTGYHQSNQIFFPEIVGDMPDEYIVNAPQLNTKFFMLETRHSNGPGPSDPKTYKATFLDGKNYIVNSERGDLEYTQIITNNPRKITDYTKFNITSDKGFNYSFGNPSATYTSITPLPSRPEDIIAQLMQYPKISTLQLEKIISPKKNEIEYEYEDYKINYIQQDINFTHYYGVFFPNTLGTVSLGDSYYRFENNYDPYAINNPNGFNWNKINNTGQIHPKRLKKIKFEQGSIIFYYNIPRKDYDGDSLDKIEIKNTSGKIIKTINFYYDYFTSNSNILDNYNNLRLKLTKIVDSSIGTYDFEYGNDYISNIFPSRNSSETDFLGYFNQNGSTRTNFPTTESNSLNPDFYPKNKLYYYPNLTRDHILPFKLKNIDNYKTEGSIDKSASKASLIGLLTKVIYPTGGGLILDYENDDFNYLNENYILGSARIKRMKYISENGTVYKENSFKYSDISTGKSYGLVNYFTPLENSTTNYTNGSKLNAEGSFINYSKVTIEENNKGSIERSYSTFSDYEDVYPKYRYDNNIENLNELVSSVKMYSRNAFSRQNLRGHLLKESIYDSNNKLLSTKINNYGVQNVNNILMNPIITFHYRSPVYSFGAIHNIPIERLLINESNKYDYFDSKVLNTIEKYSYHDNGNLYTKKIFFPNEKILETQYQYARERNNQYLINKNIISTPLQSTNIKTENTIAKITSKSEVVYPINQIDADVNSSGLPLPKSIISFDIQDPNDTAEIKVTYDLYDNKGNILQYSEKGKPTSIIWGYNQSLPIARIEGATYSQVYSSATNIITASNTDNLQETEVSEQLLISSLDNFRNNFALTNYQITTYTHNPLVGTTTITSPTGIKETYKYDSANRLEHIQDINKNILKEYNYHYKNELTTTFYNEAKDQTFTRNNCPPEATPGSYNYKIPANTYSSIISKYDADQKAQNDINNNGQKTANIYALCNNRYCTVSPTYINPIYYSSFEEVTFNHIKAILSFPINNISNSGNSWSNGFIIGTLSNSCTPKTVKSFNISSGGKSWNVSINQGGNISIQLSSGSISNGEVISLNFEYDKN